MRRVELSATEGQEIESFGSRGFSALSFAPKARVTVCRLDAGGAIGQHAAPVDQLFVVVSGAGVVACGTESLEVRPGQAVLMEPGNQHETTSPKGLLAVIIECPGLAEQH